MLGSTSNVQIRSMIYLSDLDFIFLCDNDVTYKILHGSYESYMSYDFFSHIKLNIFVANV